MRWGTAVLVAALLLAACATGPPVDAPVHVRLEQRFAAWAARGGVPAATVVVRRDGDLLWQAGHATGIDTQFRIASISKLFVAAMVMQLVEDGDVSLDDDASRILGRDLGGATVRQLLNHTSGLPDYGTEEFVAGLQQQRERLWSEEQVLDSVAEFRPSHAAGSGWEYSNTNYVALAALVEKITGAPWSQTLRAHILDPLGLDATYVAARDEPVGRGIIPEAFFDLDNDGAVEDVEEGAWPALETSEGAAGAMVSTAADVAHFTEALFAGHILSPAGVAAMVRPGPFPHRYDDYGLGVELRRPDLQTPVWGHGGFLPGYRSVTWFVPSTRTTITVLANHSEANPADLADLLMAELS